MAATVTFTPATIRLKGRNHHEEATLSEAAKPGHFVKLISDGTVEKNDLSTGADIQLKILIENYLVGGLIATAWTVDEVCMYYIPVAGDHLYVRIPASASAIVLGDRMQLDNTACAIKLASGKPVLVALEAVDNSSGSDEVFIRAEVI